MREDKNRKRVAEHSVFETSREIVFRYDMMTVSLDKPVSKVVRTALEESFNLLSELCNPMYPFTNTVEIPHSPFVMEIVEDMVATLPVDASLFPAVVSAASAMDKQSKSFADTTLDLEQIYTLVGLQQRPEDLPDLTISDCFKFLYPGFGLMFDPIYLPSDESIDYMVLNKAYNYLQTGEYVLGPIQHRGSSDRVSDDLSAAFKLGLLEEQHAESFCAEGFSRDIVVKVMQVFSPESDVEEWMPFLAREYVSAEQNPWHRRHVGELVAVPATRLQDEPETNLDRLLRPVHIENLAKIVKDMTNYGPGWKIWRALYDSTGNSYYISSKAVSICALLYAMCDEEERGNGKLSGMLDFILCDWDRLGVFADFPEVRKSLFDYAAGDDDIHLPLYMDLHGFSEALELARNNDWYDDSF